VAGSSFDEAVRGLERTTGGKVPKRQAEALAGQVSQDFEAFYASRGSDEPEPTLDPGVMSLDGKGVVMRREDLREATRKAAERKPHKRKTRLSRGEKRNRKRMATVAAVYSVERTVRGAESIRGIKAEQDPSPKPRARNKRVWARVQRAPQAVTEELFAEALRRDPERRRPWVMVVDGHEGQLEPIQASIEHHRVEVTLILDFIHVLEYRWKAAWSFFTPGSEEAEQWVGDRALQSLKGKASEVAAGMRRAATLRQLPAPERKPVDTRADYRLKYRAMVHYDGYLAQGLPLATGVSEGAGRHLVKDRLDITGARWRLRSAEAVLKLRSLHSSGAGDAYWDFHKAQALRRNHSARIENRPLQKAA
jgi:hypothetical protein